MKTGRNTVLIGQQKRQNVSAGHVINVLDHALCLLSNGVYTSRWTLELILAMTMRFPPHTKDKGYKHDQPEITSPFLAIFICWKTQSEEVIPFAQFHVLR